MDLAALLILAAVFLAREWVHQMEMREEAEQRSMLLQRIQAPREIAYREFAETLPPGAPSQPIYTDEETWEALGQLPPKASETTNHTDEVSDWERLMRAAE